MLRITVHDYPGAALVLQLEGRLSLPWLRTLEHGWRKIVASRGKHAFTVDLTGVTLIDAAGKACLAAMHGQGASFLASNCLTKSIVEEITRA